MTPIFKARRTPYVELLVVLGIFAVIAVSGHESLEAVYTAARDTRQMLNNGEPVLVQEDYWSGLKLLRRVRQETLDSAFAARGILAGRSATSASDSRAALETARRELARAVKEADGLIVPPTLLPQWSLTRQVIDDYRETLDHLLSAEYSSSQKAVQQIGSRQTAVLRELEKLADQMWQVARQEKRVLVFTDQLEQQLYRVLAFCLFMVAALLGVPMAHTWVSQRRMRVEHAQTLAGKQNLEKLQAKLVRAQEEERRTISRELHDEIGQLLTAARLDLAALENKLPPELGDLRTVAVEGKELVEQSLRRVRDLTQLLRPSLLEEQGLVSAVKWLIRGFASRTRIDVELDVKLENRLPIEYEIAAFRMVQESLNNIAKHSGASAAKVLIASDGRNLMLRVEDNGSGLKYSIRTAASTTGGLGLVGIRERVEYLGGRLNFVSLEKGLCLLAEVPLPSGPKSEQAAESVHYKASAAS